ncbi:MAG: hypothetical protein ACRC5T_05070 [Cetobacterium sp.]
MLRFVTKNKDYTIEKFVKRMALLEEQYDIITRDELSDELK